MSDLRWPDNPKLAEAVAWMASAATVCSPDNVFCRERLVLDELVRAFDSEQRLKAALEESLMEREVGRCPWCDYETRNANKMVAHVGTKHFGYKPPRSNGGEQ